MILPPNHQENNGETNSKQNDIDAEMGQIGDESSVYFHLNDIMYNKRLVSLIQVMKHHMQYLDPFIRVHKFILHGDGPLPYDVRNYIAIMAAARHRCCFLVNMQKLEFISSGGNAEWLKGIQNIPKKLRDLNEINKILAHQPWLINKGHIEKLTKGSDSWSLSEVVHAIVIISHFHTLCSFVYGSGLNDDESFDEPNGHINGVDLPSDIVNSTSTSSNASPPPSPPLPDDCSSGSVEILMKKMQDISEHKLSENETQDMMMLGFDKIDQFSELNSNTDSFDSFESELLKYMEDCDFNYVDFARRREGSDIPTFRVQDYSWNDQGFSLVNRLYSDVGNLLDEKFKIAYELTYNNMGKKKNVDTSMFRRAIWNYIQCVYGIRHDDYDYREVNELLDREFKTYIKTLCCFPHRVRKGHCETIMKELRRSEKIHVNLMISEARMQAEMLYALRSIMKYMT